MAEVEHDEDISPREALEAAFEQAEAADETPEPLEPSEEEETEGAAGGAEEDEAEVLDEDDEDTTAEGADLEEEDADEDASGDTRSEHEEDEEDEGSGPDDSDDGGDTGRAPVSWSPAVREHWEKLPADVKAQITKREQEIQQTLGETTRARRFTEAWEQMLGPYEPLMAAQGANTYQGVQRLLQIGAGLSMGNPVQKADIITKLIQQYQVDLHTLDEMLAGQYQGADPQVERMLQERLAPIQQELNQYRQQTQQTQNQTREQTASEIQAFSSDPKNEFFEDVRNEMADLMEIAARNQRSMSLQEAYDRACQMNPEIRSILEQRSKSQAASKRSKAVLRKKKAASSVRGRPGGVEEGDTQPEDLGSAIRDAWSQAERRRSRV